MDSSYNFISPEYPQRKSKRSLSEDPSITEEVEEGEDGETIEKEEEEEGLPVPKISDHFNEARAARTNLALESDEIEVKKMRQVLKASSFPKKRREDIIEQAQFMDAYFRAEHDLKEREKAKDYLVALRQARIDLEANPASKDEDGNIIPAKFIPPPPLPAPLPYPPSIKSVFLQPGSQFMLYTEMYKHTEESVPYSPWEWIRIVAGVVFAIGALVLVVSFASSDPNSPAVVIREALLAKLRQEGVMGTHDLDELDELTPFQRRRLSINYPPNTLQKDMEKFIFSFITSTLQKQLAQHTIIQRVGGDSVVIEPQSVKVIPHMVWSDEVQSNVINGMHTSFVMVGNESGNTVVFEAFVEFAVEQFFDTEMLTYDILFKVKDVYVDFQEKSLRRLNITKVIPPDEVYSLIELMQTARKRYHIQQQIITEYGEVHEPHLQQEMQEKLKASSVEKKLEDELFDSLTKIEAARSYKLSLIHQRKAQEKADAEAEAAEAAAEASA